MVTDLKSRLSYHRRLFLLLLLFSWTLVACFVLFQYGREKHFKAEQLNARGLELCGVVGACDELLGLFLEFDQIINQTHVFPFVSRAFACRGDRCRLALRKRGPVR